MINPLLRMAKVLGKASSAAMVLAMTLSCSTTKAETEQRWLSFRCPDGRTVIARFERQDDFVNMRFEDRDLRLPHVISGSGARYSDGKTTLWNKGDSVFVEVNDKIVVRDCMLEGKAQG